MPPNLMYQDSQGQAVLGCGLALPLQTDHLNRKLLMFSEVANIMDRDIPSVLMWGIWPPELHFMYYNLHIAWYQYFVD